ncbi:MAG: DUF502 domain-containing protein [Planctomycetales bacterium]|nr:DUF502 domain-containing protein [Planctomycetales bacterium]
MAKTKSTDQDKRTLRSGTFRRAVLRGLGVVLPPLLTLMILVWVFGALQTYILQPVETASKIAISWVIDDTRAADQISEEEMEANEFTKLPSTNPKSNLWIPTKVFDDVNDDPGEGDLRTSRDYYNRYIEISYLKRFIVVPLFFCLFILMLYFLGRFLAYGVGRVLYLTLERTITQVPFIRTVYSSVKQVTDFVFSHDESGLEFNRVVAIEYPRVGIWSLGFVTGESMLSIREAANEPVLSILIPTSPMPATGYTITVRKSETVDLDISVDQAFQFIVSCGVVVPIPQLQDRETDEVREIIESQIG